jgi:hypothetical protein
VARYAILSLVLGEPGVYRLACDALLGWPGMRPDSAVAALVARTALVHPSGGDASELLEVARDASPRSDRARSADTEFDIVGAALHRAGRHAAAVERLRASTLGERGFLLWTTWNGLFLVMALHAMNHDTEAETVLTRIEPLLDDRTQVWPAQYLLELEILRSEAGGRVANGGEPSEPVSRRRRA